MLLLPHIHFFLINIAVFAVILFIDRKNARHYLLLGLIGLGASLPFENLTTLLGFWNYHSEPKIPFFSLYTWLLYVPYFGFCYFAARRLRNHV